MNLKDYQTVFTVTGLALILAAAAPVIGLFVSFEDGAGKFSELWILGPDHLAKDYPFDIRANVSHTVFVGVGNHMGGSSYYMVLVKLRNQTQSSPNTTASIPSLLLPLSEFRFFITDGRSGEAQVHFSVLDVSRSDGSEAGAMSANSTVFVSRLSINDVIFPINSSAHWDSEYIGFYYQLFFELWRYDLTLRSFRFDNRFVGIWLNVTS